MIKFNFMSLQYFTGKVSFRSISLASMLVVSLMGCNGTPSLPSELANSSFEQNENGRPTSWFVDAKVEGKGQVESYQLGNNKLLRLVPNGKNTGKDLLGVGQMLDASFYRGKTITVTALIGAKDGANAVLGVHVLGDGNDYEYVQFNQSNSDAKLVSHSDSLFVASNAKNIVVYAITNTVNGEVFFDDISFSVEQVTDDTPKNAETDQVSIASIYIDLSQTIRKVPAEIFGTNVEWIYNGQGLWDEKDKQINSQATSIAKESGFQLIRFPGGVFSDYYNWRDGIGPQEKRPSRKHYPDGPSSVSHFGTDEVLNFADNINAELLITVNVGHGTAEMAAQWVDYLNVKKKKNVSWWEIGNELYMDGDLSGAEIDAREYAKRYEKFAKAMKAIDPSIKLGAIGGLNYGRYAFIKDPDWTEDVLDQVGGEVDFLAVHNAYAPVMMGGGENINPIEVYKTMLAAPANIDNNLHDLDKLLSKFDNKKRKIKIAVTEWGPFFHVLPSSKWVDHIKTLGSSLFVGSTLNTFLRHPRVEVANAFKLTDHGFMGWIGNTEDEFRATAPLKVFSLYQNSIGGIVVATNVQSDTFNTKSLGVIDAVKNVPFLDVTSVKKDKELFIYVVNKNLNSIVSTKIDISNGNGYRTFNALSVTGKSVDSHTGTELPKIPGLKWADQVVVSRFNKGAKNEVFATEKQGDFDSFATQQSLEYEFPAMSVTRLTLSQ